MLLEKAMIACHHLRNDSLELKRKGEKSRFGKESDFRTSTSEIVLGILLLSPLSLCQLHPSMSVKSSLRRYKLVTTKDLY